MFQRWAELGTPATNDNILIILNTIQKETHILNKLPRYCNNEINGLKRLKTFVPLTLA